MLWGKLFVEAYTCDSVETCLGCDTMLPQVTRVCASIMSNHMDSLMSAFNAGCLLLHAKHLKTVKVHKFWWSQTCKCKKGSGWKLSTIFLSCKVFHDWSIIKLGNILYLLDGPIFAVLFGRTSHCFC